MPAPAAPTFEPPTPEGFIELHPAALQVCLSAYFAMAYKSLPPFLPSHLFYDGLAFYGNANRKTNKIELMIKTHPFDNGVQSETQNFSFDIDQFKHIYIR